MAIASSTPTRPTSAASTRCSTPTTCSISRRSAVRKKRASCTGCATTTSTRTRTHDRAREKGSQQAQHGPYRETRRAARAAFARVAGALECERVRHLVPHEPRRRVRRGQDGPGNGDHSRLRALEGRNAGRTDRARAVFLVSLAPLSERSHGGLLSRAHDTGRVHARGRRGRGGRAVWGAGGRARGDGKPVPRENQRAVGGGV